MIFCFYMAAQKPQGKGGSYCHFSFLNWISKLKALKDDMKDWKKKFGNLEIKKAKIFKVVFDSEKYRKKKKVLGKWFLFSYLVLS